MPTPVVDISSSLDNPIPRDSIPTLRCIIRLDPSVDREVEVSVSWSGPVYGFGEFTKTEPVLNSSAEVPTYTSSVTLNAEETFYDSGQYSCLVVVSPLMHNDYIRSTPTSGQSISGM